MLPRGRRPADSACRTADQARLRLARGGLGHAPRQLTAIAGTIRVRPAEYGPNPIELCAYLLRIRECWSFVPADVRVIGRNRPLARSVMPHNGPRTGAKGRPPLPLQGAETCGGVMFRGPNTGDGARFSDYSHVIPLFGSAGPGPGVPENDLDLRGCLARRSALLERRGRPVAAVAAAGGAVGDPADHRVPGRDGHHLPPAQRAPGRRHGAGRRRGGAVPGDPRRGLRDGVRAGLPELQPGHPGPARAAARGLRAARASRPPTRTSAGTAPAS